MRQLVLLVTFFGCSETTQPAGDPTFTMQLEIAAGTETTLCQFVKMPAGKAYVTSAHHEYTPGSHHMLLYRTDLTKIDAGMDQVQDCYEGGGGTIMSHVRGVIYGSQEPKGATMLPEGVGYQVASEEVLLLQVHYLNATAAPLRSTVTVSLHTTPTPVAHLAGVLFFYDPFIDVPAGAMATANARCTLPKDITLLGVFPHYHARGVGYRAYLDLPSQPVAADPFYTSTDWNHPAEWTGGPMKLNAGTAIRWYCDYDNTAGSDEFFQGPSARTNEMCMFTGAYYPAMDAASEGCYSGMSMFGSGTATCGATLTCLQACPAGSAPTKLGSGMGDVDPCWQKCFTQSCASASTPLLAQLNCLGANCAAECAAGNCSTCAQQKCLTQSIDCLNATCN
jgi:hypothetical protein